MKSKQKLLALISCLFIFGICVVFLTNTNQVTKFINLLNNKTQDVTASNCPQKLLKSELTTVNTAALGKYKINTAPYYSDGFININPESLVDLCNQIIDSEGKILILCNNENLTSELYISCLQFIAGDDYDNVINFYLTNFNSEDKELAKSYFNQYFANMLELDINDIPYINLQKYVKDYLIHNGFNADKIDKLKNKLKENFD